MLAAGSAGPLGGDELSLEIDVGSGSSLVLSEVSPTLLLPGPHGQQSRIDTNVRVEADGTFIWVPDPVIAARGCHHLNSVAIELAATARLLWRDEILLGRHGEPHGRLTQRVRVRHEGQPLYYQDLHFGAIESRSPAVLGGHRAIGSILIVEPAWTDRPPPIGPLGEGVVLMPLLGPALLITALAADNLALRHRLDSALESLGAPWDPQPQTPTAEPTPSGDQKGGDR